MVVRRTQVRIVLLILCLLGAAIVAARASSQSLGEVARQLRAKRALQPKAVRVYTNDNLPRERGVSVVGAGPESKPEAEEKAASEGEKKPSRAELEKAYPEKAAKLREALAWEEKKWAELQRQLNLGRQQEVQRQRAAVEAARKALEDLEEELRRKGLPPGWAR